jgi:hypothetical protein
MQMPLLMRLAFGNAHDRIVNVGNYLRYALPTVNARPLQCSLKRVLLARRGLTFPTLGGVKVRLSRLERLSCREDRTTLTFSSCTSMPFSHTSLWGGFCHVGQTAHC